MTTAVVRGARAWAWTGESDHRFQSKPQRIVELYSHGVGAEIIDSQTEITWPADDLAYWLAVTLPRDLFDRAAWTVNSTLDVLEHLFTFICRYAKPKVTHTAGYQKSRWSLSIMLVVHFTVDSLILVLIKNNAIFLFRVCGYILVFLLLFYFINLCSVCTWPMRYALLWKC